MELYKAVLQYNQFMKVCSMGETSELLGAVMEAVSVEAGRPQHAQVGN